MKMTKRGQKIKKDFYGENIILTTSRSFVPKPDLIIPKKEGKLAVQLV